MTANRSVPTDSVLPHVAYRSVPEAVSWLGRVFGFREHYRYGEPGGEVSGAQVFAGKACLMLKRARGEKTPAELGYGTQMLTIFVEDVAAHYARAVAEGAEIVEELQVTVYGERQYGVVDLDGHRWLFSEHAVDVAPGDWGARVAETGPVAN